jgi:SARP family transcriptional regulator, regulator of embCAB operon
VARGVAITGFGRFSVVADGEERTRAFSPRTRRCLAHLAIREAPVERVTLAVELWPEADETTALGNLRRRLHELEGAFERLGIAAPLELTRDRVVLAPAVQWSIDVARYSILSRDPAKTDRAAALYREPIFPGIDDDVLERERRRLHGVQMELLTRLLDISIGRGDAEAIAAFATALVRLDPLCEQSVAKAVAALNALGEVDRGRRLYERLNEAMRAEIDLEPAPLVLDEGMGEAGMKRVLRPLAERGEALRRANAGRQFPEIEKQIDTIRAALDAAIVRELDVELGARALAALSRFFFDRGHAVEAFRWYEAAIARLPQSSPLRAEALYLRAMVGRNLGNPDHNLPAFEEAIEALRRVGDRGTLAKAMLYGSNAARMTGRVEISQELAREAHAILEESGDAYLVAFARSALGAAAYARGDLDVARRELERARVGFEALGAGDDEALMRVDVARCAFAQGDLPTAEAGLTDALSRSAESGNRYVEGHARVGLTLLALDCGELRGARAHAARAAEISLNGSDMELSVIALEAAGELFLALGEFARARDALAAADGVRSEYLIARAPTEHARCERLRGELALHSMLLTGALASPDIMLRSLLESLTRSYRNAAQTL